MATVCLFHWKQSEVDGRATKLQEAGHEVVTAPLDTPDDLQRIKSDPPEAFVIDLSRIPSRGRDLAIWLRKQKPTRAVPLVIVGGSLENHKKLKRHLPDAVYTDWRRIAGALKRALAYPPKKPVVPQSSMAGYSGTPLPKKLGIKPGALVAVLGAPEEFEETLGPLPDGAEVKPGWRGRRQLTICFCTSQRELERRMPRLAKVATQGTVWVAWPKKASGLATDLTQNEVRRAGLAAGLVDYKICAIDQTWSGLAFALRKKK